MTEYKFDYFCTSCTKDETYRKENCISKAVIKSYKKGETIVLRGDTATSLLMIKQGKIANETILESGISLIAIEHSAPYPLGVLALFAKNNYFRVDSRATEECEVAVISREEIEKQIARCPIFMRNFIAYSTEKLDTTQYHLAILSCKNIKAKIAFYLLSTAKENRFEIKRSTTELATYFCVERPSLSRAIKQLEDDGIIKYSRGKGEILDTAALKELLV